MSYIPPEFAHEPMEITQRGSIICSYRRWMTGAILMNTVPAITIRSASRGVPRITSAPKRATSYLLVKLVAISTKQQESPKPKGQMEFLRPQASKSCRRESTTLRRTCSSKEADCAALISSAEPICVMVVCIIHEVSEGGVRRFLHPPPWALR